MAEPETELKPESYTFSGLSDLYVACLTAAEQIRRLKVRYKVRYRYCRLVEHLAYMLHCHVCPCQHKDEEHKKRDEKQCGHCVICWSFCVLHRIEHLGGDADSTIGVVTVSDEVKTGLTTILMSLENVYDMAQVILDDKSADKPTAKVAGEIQCAADSHIECVKAHLRQIDDMGVSYLTTLV